MTPRFAEITTAITSLAALAAAVLYFQDDLSYYNMSVLAASWGIWMCSCRVMPEYTKYALALGMLLPVGMVAHMLYDGELLAAAALPALVRGGMLLSLHDRVWTGCVEIARDIRG